MPRALLVPLLGGVGGLLLVWLVGPLATTPLLLLAVPRVRSVLGPARLRRVLGGVAGAVLVAVVALAATALAPPGRLPFPPGAGRWVVPAYVGRAASPVPARGLTGGEARSGPLGDSPGATSASYGGDDCGTPLPVGDDRLLTVCVDGSDRTLRLLEAPTLHSLDEHPVAVSMPATEEAAGCGRGLAALRDGRVAVALTGTTVEILEPAGDELRVVEDSDLARWLAGGDCVVGLTAAARGEVWWVTARGRVGALDLGVTTSVRAVGPRPVDLPGRAQQPVRVVDGVAYVATSRTTAALTLRTDEAGERIDVRWRQPTSGGGATPAWLPGTPASGPVLALTGNPGVRTRVDLRRAGDGTLLCRRAVPASATGPVVVAAAGVVVQGSGAWSGMRSTVLGRAPDGGLTRVDLVDGRCETTWRTDVVAPGATAAFSPLTGLVYAWTTRASWTGVSAWSLSALDARTGDLVFATRAGIGSAYSPRRATITLGADAAAYVSTVGGFVRVADRAPVAP